MAFVPDKDTTTIPSSIPAPGINPDAVQLQDVQNNFNQEDQGINPDAAIKTAQTGLDLADAVNKLDDVKKKAVLYKAMQTALNAGIPEYEIHWKAAGSPPEFSPDKLQAITGALPPDKAQDTLVTFYKGITDKSDQNDIEAGRTQAASDLAAGESQSKIASDLSIKDSKFDPVASAKQVADRTAKDATLQTKLTYWQSRDDARNATILKAAKIAHDGTGDYSGIVDEATHGITDADTDIAGKQKELDAVNADIGTDTPTKSQEKARNDLMSAISKTQEQKVQLTKELFKAQGKGGHRTGTPSPKTHKVYDPATGTLK